MRVFRWQHKTCGNGPLCGYTDFPWSRHFKHHNFPIEDSKFRQYSEENEGLDLEDHYFAWVSLEMLLDNLKDGAIDALEEYGFELTEWEAEDRFVTLSDGQVFFHRASAERIS